MPPVPYGEMAKLPPICRKVTAPACVDESRDASRLRVQEGEEKYDSLIARVFHGSECRKVLNRHCAANLVLRRGGELFPLPLPRHRTKFRSSHFPGIPLTNNLLTRSDAHTRDSCLTFATLKILPFVTYSRDVKDEFDSIHSALLICFYFFYMEDVYLTNGIAALFFIFNLYNIGKSTREVCA